MSKIVGADTIFEASFFNPKILADKWHKITKNKYAYVEQVLALDLYYKLNAGLLGIIGNPVETIKSFAKTVARLYRDIFRHDTKAVDFSDKLFVSTAKIESQPFINIHAKLQRMRIANEIETKELVIPKTRNLENRGEKAR